LRLERTGTYQLGNATKHFESTVKNGSATIKVPRENRRCKFILTNPEDRIFDLRDVATELTAQEPNWSSDEELIGGAQDRSLSDIIPASDRIVRLNHNSKSYQETMTSLNRLIEAVETTNEYDDAEDKDERLAELSAGRRLLEAVRVRSNVVWRLLARLGVEVPRVPNTLLRTELRKRFVNLDPKALHLEMVHLLKRTRDLAPLSELLNSLPPSLHAAALTLQINRSSEKRLIDVVRRPVVIAKASEIRAPVRTRVRQKAPTKLPSAQAAFTNALRSSATRYFRCPQASNNEPLMNDTSTRIEK
jgi:Asp-tRNA(Asn)/Glu-tRNA(Gln) amidotransferase C subunit